MQLRATSLSAQATIIATLITTFSLTIQANSYRQDQVLVKFKVNAPSNAKAELKRSINAKTKHAFRLVNGLETLSIPAGNVDKVLKALKHNPNVAYAEPDYIIELNSITPNDSDYSNLWGMERIEAPQAWSITTGDADQIIAVVDSGVDFEHPDLVNNMWVNSNEVPNDGIDNDNNGYIDDIHGYDFVNNDGSPMDDESHGTHVAGTICAEGNNNVGVVGVVWQCKIMAVKFLGADKRGSYSDAIQAIEYSVAMGAKLANHSWGGSSYSQSMYDAINSARSNGQMLVVSAGNKSVDIDITPAYPASYTLDNIITVANIESGDVLRASSSWGEVGVDLGAPGGNIYSTVPGGYGSKNGTSMAAPHVTGALALIKTLQPTLNNNQLRSTLLGSVETIPALEGITVTGGLLNLANAVDYQAPPAPDTGTIESTINASTNDAEESVTTGDVYIDSSDLEFGYDAYVSANQVVGIRFTNLAIPQGSIINNASVTFTVDETASESTQMQISAENSPSSAAFTSERYNISSRSRTNETVQWSIPVWSTIGSKQQTPDLTALVQAIINRSDWQAGNNIAFIFEGTGLRTAEAYDGVPTAAASLTVAYSQSGEQPTNIDPVASFRTDVTEGSTPLNVLFTDLSSDPDGSIASWHWDFGDGTTSSIQHPNHTFTTEGVYTVTLTVTDNNQANAQASTLITSNAAQISQVPNAPSNLSITLEKSGKGKNAVTTAMFLHWQDNADNEEYFVIERCLELRTGKGKNATTTCDYSTYLNNVAANTTSVEIEIASGYQYRMKAVNSSGDSLYSGTVKSR